MPYFIDINNQKKYILNIIDHFSKMCQSYILNNKKAFNILICIEDFIKKFGKPKSIGSDNGRELKNVLINDFMEDNNIKFVHGLPYKPHSQGVCERVHRTIKTGLIVKKIQNNHNYNLEQDLEDTINFYNNTLHNVTKATPNEIFFSTNLKFLKKIKSNIIKYYTKNKKVEIDIDLDNKILIGSNILVKRCKKENLVLIEKNKVKSNNLLYNICAVIVRIHNAGIYDALIKKDYIDYNLKCNDICRISSDSFKKVSEEIWENIL